MKRPFVLALVACASVLAPSSVSAQPCVPCGPPPRPIVIVGGWSNCPAHFSQTSLVNDLRIQRAGRVLLTTHRDPWGDINDNAIAEARQVKTFLDGLGSVTSFDLVGFSMGGVIVRSIVLDHGGELGPYKVANLVTMATPNHGANPFLTNIDPGLTLATSPDGCARPGGPVQYHGNVASRQMAPDSDFLRRLNARRIPASIRVVTIAGNVELDAVQPSIARDIAPTLCDSCSPLGFVPEGVSFHYNDRFHGACKTRGGSCDKSTGCPPHQDKFQDVDGVWKCRAKFATPTTTTVRQALGSDGFIRVASVQLTNSEAENIQAQHVFGGVYHTQGTEDEVRRGPNPKALVSATGAAPTNPGFPIVGTAVNGSWFFEDSRVTAVLKGLSLGVVASTGTGTQSFFRPAAGRS